MERFCSDFPLDFTDELRNSREVPHSFKLKLKAESNGEGDPKQKGSFLFQDSKSNFCGSFVTVQVRGEWMILEKNGGRRFRRKAPPGGSERRNS
ncbi:hypothetical protein CH375_00510 [Leptospira ellisii]|uniref:Uncharacterized protein n=1 Tax=Leptospira ellisii TaxID=2023197 RepID=A0A2N0BQR0_9LEPT|nr:hypothetical protein CH379_15195 [Leptospira ellisii]PKA06293.1 hypothetical protein CH375_00510 [Leptospira ellisii]